MRDGHPRIVRAPSGCFADPDENSCLSTHLSNHAPAAAAAAIARETTMIAPVQALVEQVQAFVEQQVDPDPLAHQRIAVLVPCYNEEAAIAKVVADFRARLTAEI